MAAVTADELFGFIFESAEEIDWTTDLPRTHNARLRRGVIGSRREPRDRLVRELEQRGLVTRPHQLS